MIRYITHPQVVIDPTLEIGRWSLSDIGLARVTALAKSGVLRGTKTVISSAEVKAIETARPLAHSLGCDAIIRPDMNENDRSATGYFPSGAFEAAADQFFAFPTSSYKGWETATAAQTRIVTAFFDAVGSAAKGDILCVGHGAVGTLLYCHLARVPISRIYDQPPGGGSFFELDNIGSKPKTGWAMIEALPPSTP